MSVPTNLTNFDYSNMTNFTAVNFQCTYIEYTVSGMEMAMLFIVITFIGVLIMGRFYDFIPNDNYDKAKQFMQRLFQANNPQES